MSASNLLGLQGPQQTPADPYTYVCKVVEMLMLNIQQDLKIWFFPLRTEDQAFVLVFVRKKTEFLTAKHSQYTQKLRSTIFKMVNMEWQEKKSQILLYVENYHHTGSSWADFNHGLVVRPQGCQGCQKIHKNILQINLLS